MEHLKLMYDTAKIVEITPEYIGVLMDNSVLYNIGLRRKDTELDIKKGIISHACDDEDTGNYVVPFSRIDEIPENIRNKLNQTINLKDLKEEISIEEEKNNTIKQVSCSEARGEILPSIDEFFESLYEKEIKNNSDKYNMLLERIKIAYTLFPTEMGEMISVKKYEEIISGL